MRAVVSGDVTTFVCDRCGVWDPQLVTAHPACASSHILMCPRCEKLLSSELVTPDKMVFRCRASHGTFVPHDSPEAIENPSGVDEVFQQFKEKVESTIARTDVQAHFDLAVAYREMGLLHDALAAVDTALAIDPSFPKAARLRADLIEELRRH